MEDTELLKLLVRQSFLSKDDAKTAFIESKKKKQPVQYYLLSNDLLTKNLLGQALAESFKVDYADFNGRQASKELAEILPPNLATELKAVVYEQTKDVVRIASATPNDPDLKTALQEFFGAQKIEIMFALEEDIEQELVQYRTSLATRFDEIKKSGIRVAPNMIEAIIADAVAVRASDIHFEPEQDTTTVRMRVDGVLHDVGDMDSKLYNNVINRIKVLARLRIDEHDSVQDGAINYHKEETGDVDMRVSIAPTVTGEKIVIRLLTASSSSLTTNDLGLSDTDQAMVEAAGKKPFGMIIVTGPTGSGKTTSLYSLMKFMKHPGINITTIEDPVEYKIPGIAQIQVNKATGITFEEGLRSIVRQDPDVILVGEVRDQTTAEIAVNSALTGHLMLTTFHANDAATAVPRLLELGVEPFLLASTLELIVAQRLLRRLCMGCRSSVVIDTKKYAVQKGLSPEATSDFLEMLGTKNSLNAYMSKGCHTCNGTGYKGRIGVFEIINFDDELRDLILKKPSKNEIWAVASKGNASTLFEDGLQKVALGFTSLDELLRVVPIQNKKNK